MSQKSIKLNIINPGVAIIYPATLVKTFVRFDQICTLNCWNIKKKMINRIQFLNF